jgi:hypothetical protein
MERVKELVVEGGVVKGEVGVVEVRDNDTSRLTHPDTDSMGNISQHMDNASYWCLCLYS